MKCITRKRMHKGLLATFAILASVLLGYALFRFGDAVYHFAACPVSEVAEFKKCVFG